ncbi:MAG: L-serine ammonia-lyase [Burkholderiales bacterium]|nr:L-serine ammonia-lyase [Burkholderiales bacterium]
MYVSAFELYRIGPGPSSTYTVGPQRAALRFVHDVAADGLLPSVHRVEAELYGGLAFHGREHASRDAIVAGLSGQLPERCDAAALALCRQRAEAEAGLALDGRHRVRFDPSRDLRQVVNHSLAFDGNAVRFLARDMRGDVVASRLYFSTGGGAILAEGDAAGGAPGPRVPYAYASAMQLLELCHVHGKRVCDLVRANECALFSPGEVRAGLLRVAQAMRAAVERGLTTEGHLPGGRRRTAPSWNDASRATSAMPAQVCAVYATALGEENAAGSQVVSAPSAGASGPVGALMQLWRDSAPEKYEERAADFLLAGAAVGGLLRAAGVRQVGCQGEVGVAAAMAAAGYAAVHHGSNAQVLHAAERALEPHLGLACDLASGRIESPCIERGAQAAARAFHAAVAAVRLPNPRVGLDVLTRSVVESGRSMAGRYKTASIGGVAVNVVEC